MEFNPFWNKAELDMVFLLVSRFLTLLEFVLSDWSIV